MGLLMKADSINLRNAEILLHVKVVTVNLLITFIVLVMTGRKFMFSKQNKNQRTIHFAQKFF
jgi:hypothetical protein